MKRLLVTAVLLGLPLATSTPAQAAPEGHALLRAFPIEQRPSNPEAMATELRERVLYLAKWHPSAEVRVSAWNALRNSHGEVAIEEWLALGGGFDAAKQRARDTRSRNRAFCERVLRTHTAEFSPQVHAAAERAANGTAADQAAFVKSGYADAQRRDRAAKDADERHVREVTAASKDFVREIAEHDPGEQVRVAAQWALRPGAMDADVEEFFDYGWASGAALDLEAYRLRVADAEVERHRALLRLVAAAAEADEALKTSADVAKARAAAERAWQDVARHADAARKAWTAEQDLAASQAGNWREIARLSAEGSEALWKRISGAAGSSRDAWTAEQAEAARTVESWKKLLEEAEANSARLHT
ncbi:hypothetical protein [Streptomyces syringium]|uniref:hypothetical protein n=1 Tax=Streptomyces syringium TaxID=76729 RepID=UPI0034560145